MLFILIFMIQLVVIYAQDCAHKDGSTHTAQSCTCGNIQCSIDQFCTAQNQYSLTKYEYSNKPSGHSGYLSWDGNCWNTPNCGHWGHGANVYIYISSTPSDNFNQRCADYCYSNKEQLNNDNAWWSPNPKYGDLFQLLGSDCYCVPDGDISSYPLGGWYEPVENYKINGQEEIGTCSNYNSGGYDAQGYNQAGWNSANIHKHTGTEYDSYGYDIDGYDAEGFNSAKFHRDTGTLFNPSGYDINGYDEQGYDAQGYDAQGYNQAGWNSAKIHKYTRTIFNPSGYDIYGYDEQGYDAQGYDAQGYNQAGWNSANIHKDTDTLYDSYGYDIYGYDAEGFNSTKFHRDTGTLFNTTGYDINGFNQAGWNSAKIHKDTGTLYDSNGYDIDGWNSANIHKDTGTEYDSYGYDIYGFNSSGYDIDGFYLNGFNDDGIHKDTGTLLNPFNVSVDGLRSCANKQGTALNDIRCVCDFDICSNNTFCNKDSGTTVVFHDNPGTWVKTIGGFRNNTDYNIEKWYAYAPTTSHYARVNALYFNNVNIGSCFQLYSFSSCWFGLCSSQTHVITSSSTGQIEVEAQFDYNSDNNCEHHAGIKFEFESSTERFCQEYSAHGFNATKFHRDTGTLFNPSGYDFDGYDAEGFNSMKFHRDTGTLFNLSGYDIDGYDAEGFNTTKFHRDTGTIFNPSGYDIDGYDIAGFNSTEYHKDTNTRYNPSGWDIRGYDEEGYNIDGIDIDGYDRRGFNDAGIHKETKTLFNPQGFDVDDYNTRGFNSTGYNKYTNTLYDTEGYDIRHFNSSGYYKDTGKTFNPSGYDVNGDDINGFKVNSFENAVFDGTFNDIKVVEKNVTGTVFRGEFKNAQFNNTVLSQRTKSDVNIQYIPRGSNGVNTRNLVPYNIFEGDITYYVNGWSNTMEKHEWWYSGYSMQRYDSCDIGQDSKRITSDILADIETEFPNFYSADRCAYACGNDLKFWKYSIMWWDLEYYCYCVNDMDVCIHGRCNFPCSGTGEGGGKEPVELVYEIPHTEISSSKFEGNFSGADFTLVDIETSQLDGNFENSVFYKTSITDTVLTGHFNDVNMNFIFMDNVTLDGDFQNINFQNAILKNTHLGGNFSGADFDNAALEGSDISKITHMFPNTFLAVCPTGVPQGFVCNNRRIVGPDYNTDIRLDWLDTTTFSDIDFTGHEISLSRFNQRILPSETLSCDDATFVEDEIVTASNYVSVPLITKTYIDICTDTNKIVLSATSAEDCWSQCQLNATKAHNLSNFHVHWPTVLYKNDGECQCIGTLVGVFNKTADISRQLCDALNQCNACQVGCSSDEDCAGSLKCGSGGDAWYETNGPWGCGQALEDSGLNFCYYDVQMCSGTYREYDTDGMTLMTAESIAFEDRPRERDPIIDLFHHNSDSLTKYTDVYCKDGITWGTSGSLYPTDGNYVEYIAGNKVPRNKDVDIDACKSLCLSQKKLGFLMEFEYGAPADGTPLERTRCKCTDKYVSPSFEYTSYQCQNVATHITDDGWSQSYTMAQLNYEYYEFGEDYHLRIPKLTGIASDATFKQIGVYNGDSVEHKEAEGCSTYPCDSYEASTAEWCDMSTPETSTVISELTVDNINQCLQTCRDANARSVVIDTTQTDYGIRSDAHFKQVGHYTSGSLQNQGSADCASYPCNSYSAVTVQWCEDDTPILTTSFETVDRNQCLQTCRDANAKSVVIDNQEVSLGKSSIGYVQYGQINGISGNTLPQYEFKQWDVVQDFHLHDDNTPKKNAYFIENEEDYFPTSPTATKTNQNILTSVEICDTSSSVSTSYDSENWKLSLKEQRPDSAYKESDGVYVWSYHASFWSSWSGFYEYTRWRCANTCSNQGYKSVTMKPKVEWTGYNPPPRWVQCVCQSYNMADCPNANKKTVSADDEIVYIEFDTSKDVEEIAEITCHCQSLTVNTCSSVKTSLEGKKEYYEFLESGYNISLPTCNCQSRTADDCTHGDTKSSVTSKIYVEFDESSYEWNRYTETYPNLFVDKVPTFPTKREIEPAPEQGYEVCKYDESVSTWALVKENHICGDFSDSIELGTVCTSLDSCTPENCANACAARSDCHFFIFGNENSNDDWRGLCKMQTTSHVYCPEGFITGPTDSDDEAKFSFYEMYPALPSTVSLYGSCSADKRQIYWSSYKQDGSTRVCSIHNSSVCTREFTPLSSGIRQYDAQTFESAGTPSCEDGRYLFGARIDWRQTLKTDGWLWSMNVSGAGITFQDVQKTRRCPRDMEPGSSKAVDGVICVHGDVTSFEETTERTIPLDQTANDFCASGDRVRVFDGRGDNPGISADERFNYCAEACSKRLQPVDGTWTSNAVAFVHYEGVAGDALNGRCWCELSSGCADELEIDGLADLHFVSFGTGDTLLTTSSGSGLSVYYFLGPDTMLVSSFGNFAAGPPTVAMDGIRSSWAFPVRYEPQGDYHLYETTGQGDGKCLYKWDGCNVCQGHCDGDHSCAGDLECYSRGDSHVPGCTGTPAPNTNYCYDPSLPVLRYNSSTYNFTGMIADKIEVCPLNLPRGYICTAIDTGSSTIDRSSGVVLWGPDTILDATPYFDKVLFSFLPGFSLNWFKNVSYRFSQCEFSSVMGESPVGLAPLYMTPLVNISGVDFSKWADMDTIPSMRNTFGQVASCPQGDFVVYPDITIFKTPAGVITYRIGKINQNNAIESRYDFNTSFRRTTLDDEPVKVFDKVEGCMDYVSFEDTTISNCANAQKSNYRYDLNVTECINHCFSDASAVYNEQTGECYCENLRFPSDECEPKRWNGDFQRIDGNEICYFYGGNSLEKGYVWTPSECWELCQEDVSHFPSMILENKINSRGPSNPHLRCWCRGERLSDGCETKTKKWWETQYDASSVLVRQVYQKKYNVNYCKEAWPGFELQDDNYNTPTLMREYDIEICPTCAHKTLKIELNCNRWPCLSCPVINHSPRCLLASWPYRIDIDFEPVDEYTYKCVDNRFIGPHMNYSNRILPDTKLDLITVETLHTGMGLVSCPNIENIPENRICYDKHFHKIEDLLNVERFESYWYSRRQQITSNASCCSGLNMSGIYLKDVPFQGSRDFRGADFTNVHGDAFCLINAQLSSDYKVMKIDSPDPEGRYALIGPGVSLKNRLLKGTNMSGTNLTSTILDGTSISWQSEYGECPTGLSFDWKCIKVFNEFIRRYQFKIVGPTTNLEFENLQDFNFSGISLEFATLRYAYGRLAGCPSKLPIGWGCNEHDRYLLGPGADLVGAVITNLTTVPPWSGTLARCPDSIPNYKCISGMIIGYSSDEKIDLTNSDISGIDFSLLSFTSDNVVLRGVHGVLKACPKSLPLNYDCVNHRIIGPYVNISNTNLTGFDLSNVKLIGANLKKAYGRVSQCPKRGMGYMCSDGYIIGMQYEIPNGADWSYKDLTNVDFSKEIHLGRKNVNFYGAYGRVQNCFAQNMNMESEWVCTQHRIIGPGVNVSGLDLSEESALYSLIDFTGIHGVLKKCPVYSQLENPVQGYGCVKNVFICPGADISNLGSHFSGEQIVGLNLTGINVGGTNLSNTMVMGTFGRLSVCPSQLSAGLTCKGNYIIGLTNKAWLERKPAEQIDLQREVIVGLTLWDNIILDYSRWSRVVVKENIDAQYISGTIDVNSPNNIDCSYFSDNVQCFDGIKENGKKIKSNTMVIFSSGEKIRNGEYANGYLRGEFKYVSCGTNVTIKNTYLDDINLEGSNFQDCNLVNISGSFMGSNIIWPEKCDTLNSDGKKVIMCDKSAILHVDLRSLSSNDVEILNAHETIITGTVRDIDVESVNMSKIVIRTQDIKNIRGNVGKCPVVTTDNWLCVDGNVLLGPGQDLRDQDYSSFDGAVNIDISGCLVNENTKLPPNAIVSPNSNLIVSQEGGNILNPSAKYQFQYGKIIGPALTVNSTFNIDGLDSKDAYFTQGMDLFDATFETSQGLFKLHGLVTSLPYGYVTVWAIDNYVVGPGLKMPDFWRYRTGACRSDNITLSMDECTALGFNWVTFKDVVSGLRGPLVECFVPPESEFECIDNWIIGPNIDWKGFNSMVSIKDEWLIHPILNLHFCPSGKNCLTQPDGRYVVFGKTGHIKDSTYDLSLSDVTLEFNDITMTDVSFSNGKIHFENLKNIQLTSVSFHNMTLTTSVCDEEFRFDNSFECLNEQKIYCEGTEVFVENQVIPSHIDIENACLKNMVIEETFSQIINSISLDGTQLPEDVSMIIFNERASGHLRECPLKLPRGATCKDKMWINAYTELENKDVSGVDFSSIAFAENIKWFNVYGIVEKCPIAVPYGWGCVEFINKRTYLNGGMFLGAGVDYSIYDHLPDDIDASDIDFAGAKFDKIKRFYGFKGTMINCPIQLPKGYTCHNIIKGTCPNLKRNDYDVGLMSLSYYTILGPYVNITDADLEFVCLSEDTNLIGIHGKSSACPKLSPKLKDIGYECSEETDNYLLGPGVELVGVPFRILNSIAGIAPKVQLTHATINDKILINDVENDFNCEHIESILAETCRNKYTDDCSNNLPNYICETSNLHLGTCHGVCGNNLTSVYSEELTTNWRTIKTNSIPNHEYHIDRDADNGHQVCEHNLVIQMPIQPEKSNQFQETCLGPIGVLKSGTLIYNHLENLQESFTTHHPTLDKCNGHADSNCFYHIHNISMELDCIHDKPCELVGYIRDGFPLYSQCPGLESCYVDHKYNANNDCNLDEANGFDFTDKGITNPNGETIHGYGYVVTRDYPYLPLKYAGTYVFDFINI